jgi:hypothetical protein
MTDDDPVSPVEVAAVLGMDEGDLAGFLAGPFAPDLPDGRMRLRVALGAFILSSLAAREAMSPGLGVAIAVEAANGARIGGDASLLVAWRGLKPATCWINGDPARPPVDPLESLGSPLRQPLVVIPADGMFTDLARGIEAMRERPKMRSH